MVTSLTAPFSGGEKARLALSLIVWQKPNLLLLDERTNHLDVDTREALAAYCWYRTIAICCVLPLILYGSWPMARFRSLMAIWKTTATGCWPAARNRARKLARKPVPIQVAKAQTARRNAVRKPSCANVRPSNASPWKAA